MGFELQLKTSNEKQNIIYTSLGFGGNDINVTINSIYLYIPSLAEQQKVFNEALRENFTLSFDACVTDRKPVNAGNEYQLDIGSASNINLPFYLIVAHQKTQRKFQQDPLINSTTRFLIILMLNVTSLKSMV